MEINTTFLIVAILIIYPLISLALFKMARNRGHSKSSQWTLAIVGLLPGINVVALAIVYFSPKK